jgi:heme A synthase
MSWFRPLAVVTAVSAYLQITLGSVVRVTGSGEGCPDWPTCYGRPLPPPEVHAIIEWSHRTVGALTGLLIIATAVGALLLYRRRKSLVAWLAVVALLVVVVEGLLGAEVVRRHLSAWLVLIHLAVAMVILAALIGIAVLARAASGAAPDRRFRRLVLLATGLTFLMLLSGSSVTATEAVDGCRAWPLCGAGWTLDLGGLNALNALHRLGTLVVGVAILWVAWTAVRRFRDVPGLAAAVAITTVALMAQVGVGYVVATGGDSALSNALHVAFATAVWSGISAIAFIAWRPLVRERDIEAPSLALAREAL